MPVKVLNDSGGCSFVSIFYGILWAVDNGADIINMSLGAPCVYNWPTCSIPYIDWVIQYAIDNGVLLVAASGNESLPYIAYPAANPNVWAIGALDRNLNKTYYSNSGQSLKFVMPER